MKKLLALMLALMLVLSGLALAEQPAQQPAEPTPLTISSRLEINRDAAKDLMTAAGMPEEQIALYDTIMGIVNTATENLVIADGGFEYAINLNDNPLLSLAGEADDKGIAFNCSLVPSYVFTMSADSILNMAQEMAKNAEAEAKKEAEKLQGIDVNALTEALGGYFTEYIATFVSAVSFGDAQSGEFNVDDGQFNCMIPMNVDLVTLAKATNTLTEQLTTDPTIAAAMKATNSQQPEPLNIPTEGLPTVMANMYVNVGENGEPEDGNYIVCNIIPQDVETPSVVIKRYMDSEGLWCTVDVPEVNCNISYDQKNLYDGNGFAARVDINFGEMYMGANVLGEMSGDDTVVTSKLYYLDNVTPIATDYCTISPTGERTIAVRDDKKTVVAVEDLQDSKKAESLGNQLAMDLMINGLGGALNALTESTPEAAELINMLMGGGQATESEPVPAQ